MEQNLAAEKEHRNIGSSYNNNKIEIKTKGVSVEEKVETKLKATHINKCISGFHNVACQIIDIVAQNTESVET